MLNIKNTHIHTNKQKYCGGIQQPLNKQNKKQTTTTNLTIKALKVGIHSTKIQHVVTNRSKNNKYNKDSV